MHDNAEGTIPERGCPFTGCSTRFTHILSFNRHLYYHHHLRGAGYNAEKLAKDESKECEATEG